MIRSLFIPDVIGSYYVFPQRILGIEITKNALYATVVKAQGKKRLIENYYEERLGEGNFNELAKTALQELLKKTENIDTIRLTISSSNVVFKELSLPFVALNKIKLVLPFEVEPLLPFALNDAVIDGIITHADTQTQRSDVLVAAAKRETLNDIVALFDHNVLKPSKISVDLIELYGLYQSIPEYKTKKGIVSIIDLGPYSTRLLIIVDGVLKATRTLAKGVSSIDLPEHANRIDISTAPSYTQEKCAELLSDINFTLQTVIARYDAIKQHHILLTGVGSEIGNITDFVTEKLAIECERFYAHKIIQNGTISSKHHIGIPTTHVISLATALGSQVTQDFNLQPNLVQEQEDALLQKQLITAGVLSFIILGTFYVYSTFALRGLKTEIESSERQAINSLKSIFPLLKTSKSLTEMNNQAHHELAREEGIWFALSTHNRFSFLTYLQELSTRIDREELGLELKKLVIKAGSGTGLDTMVLEGSVKNYDALRKFEESLTETKLFKTVPKLQETKFGTITLVLDKDQKEE